MGGHALGELVDEGRDGSVADGDGVVWKQMEMEVRLSFHAAHHCMCYT